MYSLPFLELEAKIFTTLPPELHYGGEPNEWVWLTRPGTRLHSFLEAPRFDALGTLRCVDVPYGRLFITEAQIGLIHVDDFTSLLAEHTKEL